MPAHDPVDVSRRGSRSQATADRIVAAAFELLAEGHGLVSFGLTREEIARRSGLPAATIDYHFGPRSRRSLRSVLVDEFQDALVAQAVGNRELYELGADALERLPRKGVAREIIGAAILRDARDFDVSQMDEQALGRDRLYYLMLALCGLPLEATGVDYERRIREAVEQQQAAYRNVYELFCRLTGREFVSGLERTQRAINAYLEGVIVHMRFGAAPDPDEIVDTVLRLFLVTTKPQGGADIDIDEEALPASSRGANG